MPITNEDFGLRTKRLSTDKYSLTNIILDESLNIGFLDDPLVNMQYFSVRNTSRGAREFPSRLPCPALMYVPPGYIPPKKTEREN